MSGPRSSSTGWERLWTGRGPHEPSSNESIASLVRQFGRFQRFERQDRGSACRPQKAVRRKMIVKSPAISSRPTGESLSSSVSLPRARIEALPLFGGKELLKEFAKFSVAPVWIAAAVVT